MGWNWNFDKEPSESDDANEPTTRMQAWLDGNDNRRRKASDENPFRREEEDPERWDGMS